MTTKNKKPSAPKPDITVNNKWLKQCLVFSKTGEIFRFATPQENHIVADAIKFQYQNWDAFNEDTKNWPDEKLREEFPIAFKRPPKKNETRIDMSTGLYTYWASKAADRTTKPVAAGKQPKLKNRTYTRLRPDPEPEIKTPQAKACLKLLDSALNGSDTISEEKLKAAFSDVDKRSAAGLTTGQLPWRIFQYYRPSLIENKVLQHD